MMNRIEKTFQQGKVFAAYLTAGDGTLNQQLEQIHALIAGGVNLLEIGIPFSDPIADGVVIQRAMQRSLAKNTTVFDALTLIKTLRIQTQIPIILFTYYNPILALSEQHILAQAQQAGVDGILIIDLPFFEAHDHLQTCAQLNLDPIMVIAPNTLPARLPEIIQHARGFLYYACRAGTTGVRQQLPNGVDEKLKQIKQVTDLPVIVGFGIASRAASRAAVAHAQGFVVGSYFIQAIENGASPEQLTALARQINPCED